MSVLFLSLPMIAFIAIIAAFAGFAFLFGIKRSETDWKENITSLALSTLCFLVFFHCGKYIETTIHEQHERHAEAKSNLICMTTLEKALSEYRADFGTEAVVALSESDGLVSELAEEHVTENGRKVGPYLYEATFIEQCGAKKWRVRPVTATTLHIDIVKEARD